jgi:hypothetical protein
VNELVWFPPPESTPEEWPPSLLLHIGFGFGAAAEETPSAPLVVSGDARASSRTLVIGRALIRLSAIGRSSESVDGKKVMRPSSLAVSSARQALGCLAAAMERAEVEPEVSATPDGGVRIVCRHEGRELEIMADPDGGGFQLRRSGAQGQGQGEMRSFGLIDDVRVAAKLLVG